MKKLLLSVLVCTATFVQCSLNERLATNQDKIEAIKANAKAGLEAVNNDYCDGVRCKDDSSFIIEPCSGPCDQDV